MALAAVDAKTIILGLDKGSRMPIINALTLLLSKTNQKVNLF